MAGCVTIIQLPCMCENLVQLLLALSSGPRPSESANVMEKAVFSPLLFLDEMTSSYE